MAKNRIRRRVLINGEMVWVTGDTEQEYAENLMKVMMAKCEPVKVEKPKHECKAYALNWFNTYSKPNIETATAVTYERQLRLYLFPAFGSKNIEDINSNFPYPGSTKTFENKGITRKNSMNPRNLV